MAETRRFGPYSVGVTSGDKLLYPDDGITKRMVVDHYADHAAVVLRHLGNRPLSLHRFPSGIDEAGFYQKQAGEHFPSWLSTVRVEKEGGVVDHPVCTNAAGLVYLAQLGTITPHAWLSRADDVRRPDQVVFDLDPSSDRTDFDALRRAAFALKSIIEDEGMASFVMLTGSKGLHVRVPIRRGPDFDAARAWASSIAERVIADLPEMLTGEMRIAKREGRIFVDILRNAYAQTAVPPYALRARPGAPVATPVTWDELAEEITSPRQFDIRSIRTRLDEAGDVWSTMRRHARNLPS